MDLWRQHDRHPEYWQLLSELEQLAKLGDEEVAHSLADKALLAYIGDAEITTRFDAIKKWYA